MAGLPRFRLKRLIVGGLAAGATLVGGVIAVAAPSTEQRPVPLTSITLQLDPLTAIAQEKGFFKKQFDAIGIPKVSLIAAGSGGLLGAEAANLNSGGIAVAQRMIYPAVVHTANGLDAVIVWESKPSDKYRTPILVRANNDQINDIKDLEGKKFASSRVSCGYTSPFETLNKAGLPLDTRLKQGKVRFQSIDNGAANSAALLSGAIDATSTHISLPGPASLLSSNLIKVVGRSPDNGEYVNGAGRVSYFAMRAFVDKYPQAIRAFLAAVNEAREWTEAHPDEAAQVVAKATRIPLEIAKFQITDPSQFYFMKGEPSADNARETIKQFQAWYIKNGDDILSDRHLSDVQVDALVDSRFFKGGQYSVYN